MESTLRKRLSRRSWPVLILALAALLWYGSHAVGYVANLRAFVIPPGARSMAPAILPGDRISVDIRGGTPKRGEIWTFSAPNGTTLVKRAIGLPGETVEVLGGRVLIDGRPLAEPYLAAPIAYTLPPVRLGPDEYFLLGDGRNTSFDSHIWGPLPRSRLIGRVEHRFWPRGRIGPVQ
jgi:signal peptidase I